MLKYGVQGFCIKCRDAGIEQPFVIDLGDEKISSEEARAIIVKSQMTFSCSGGGVYPHTEINPLHKNVDFGEFEVFEFDNSEVLTDHDFYRQLKEQHGQENLFVISTIEGLDIPTLPRNLTHLGFGDFGNEEYVYSRHDAPSGRRIYVRSRR